jgi:Tfp pilus assembly protein PilZ
MAAEHRPALPALGETLRHRGRELDVQTVDRGVGSPHIVSNLFFEGQLLLGRTVAYAATAAPLEVREFMRAHHARLLSDLAAGALDQALAGVLPDAPVQNVTLPPAHGDTPRPGAAAPAVTTFQPGPAGANPAFLVVLQDPRAFLDLQFSKGDVHGLLLDTTQDVPLGSAVDVVVRFLGQPMRQFFLTGVAAWRRTRGTRDLKAGLGVEFGLEHKVALDRVVEFALGIHDLAADRTHPRARCRLKARVDVETGARHQATLLNVSQGGALLADVPPLPAGSVMTLHIKRGSFFSPTLRLRAVVRWANAPPGRCVGVMFMVDGAPRLRAQLDTLVDQFLNASAHS